MRPNKGAATREIKARLNILDIVRRYVELRRAGNRWVAPCPFHQETKPSFSVNEEEGFFYCFGCQAAGDIFDFYGRINGLEFRETLEQLAEEAGVTLTEYGPDPKASAERDFRKTAIKMYEFAGNHFRRNLAGEAGSECRAYLARRKVAPEIIESFELGWSLPGWRGLADSLQRAGFSPRQGVDAGLLAPGERGAYDRFRGRLIFPIKDLSGRVIAFGGRIITNEDAAKYINSTDSPIYKKGDNLYGLFQARRGISAGRRAVLTEGYMDVLTLHQFGYTNACGVLGTALTPEQVHRLGGFCSDLELIFDGDAPGRKAALRAAEMVLVKGLRCRVVLLPEGEDIDSLLQEQGKDAFEAVRAQAPDGLDFCIRTLSDSFAPKDVLDWVQGFVNRVERPELLSPYVSRLTRALDLDERELRARLPGVSGKEAAQAPKAAPVKAQNPMERGILRFLMRFPHRLPDLEDAGALLIVSHPMALALWKKVASTAPDYDPDEVLRLLDDKEKEFWGKCRVVEAPPPDHEQIEFEDIQASIAAECRDKQGKARLRALRRTADSPDADIALLKAQQEMLQSTRTPGSSDGQH